MPLASENGSENSILSAEAEMAKVRGNIVFVTPPTGEFQTDRASIKAAVAQAEPGDIIQFAQGTYVIGSDALWNGILVDVPNTTLQGHPGGTTLKGGDNINSRGQYLGFTLSGGNQTVRGFTFESFSWTTLYLNYSLYAETGGYVVEHNIFRNSTVGIMYMGQSEEVSHIQHNVFDNIGTNFWIYGKTCHIKWNKVMASEPDKVPLWGYPANVGGISAWYTPCDNNVIAFNTIDGISDGIILAAYWASNEDASCSNNLITGNKFINPKIYTEWDLGTMVMLFSGDDKTFKVYQVLNNTYLGSGGVAILSEGGTNTTISGNKINGVRELPQSFWPWLTGIGIYIDGYSNSNNLIRNKFNDNDIYDIALYGDNNTVITASMNDKVLDNGEGNVVIGTGLRKSGRENLALSKPYVEADNKKMEMMRELMRHYKERSE